MSATRPRRAVLALSGLNLAGKLLAILDNAEYILAIELMAAAQAQDFLVSKGARAQGTERVYAAVRSRVPLYGDDRPLNADIEALRAMIAEVAPPADHETGA